MVKAEKICRQENSSTSVRVILCDSPASRPPAVRAVQQAIATDLRARIAPALLDDAATSTGMGQASRIEIQPGAGALLNEETLNTLIGLAAQQTGACITLPIANSTDACGLDAPYSFETCFSVGTGADIIALSLHPHTTPVVRQAIDALGISNTRMAKALACFTNRDAEVALVGPVKNNAWRFLEERAACRVRLFADGSTTQPGIIPDLLQRAGRDAFLDWIAQIGDAIFLDSRQLFAGLERPDEIDFYNSDVGAVDQIRESATQSADGTGAQL